MSKPFNIVITGPESTGKTTLANELAKHFEVPLVSEYAREYIDDLNRAYQKQDLVKIARQQLKLQNEALGLDVKLVINDTDLLTIKIWLEDKFKTSDVWLDKMLLKSKADLYLLCNTDIPWKPDPQREDEHCRDELLNIYEKQLEKLDANWKKIKGTGKTRTLFAIQAVEKVIG